jgi:cell shape-determining protein MreC
MSSLSRIKKTQVNCAQIFAAICIISIIIILFARSFVVRTISDIGNAIDQALYGILPQGFKSARDLALDNRNLTDQLTLLKAEDADRNVLANENERLKTGFGRGDKEKIVYSSVIKRAPESPYDTFILDAGSELGVAKDDTVVVGSIVIGKIEDVGVGFARAKLLSSPGNTFDGMLGGNVAIQAKGLGGGAFEAVIPLGTDANIGDALILPSISSKIFGLVQKIEEKPAEGFKRLLFALPINPNQVGNVGIVIK